MGSPSSSTAGEEEVVVVGLSRICGGVLVGVWDGGWRGGIGEGYFEERGCEGEGEDC
jgi:hypothetical protein